MFIFIPLVIFVIILTEVFNYIIIRLLRRIPLMYYLTFFGVTFHESMHALACVITGARIREVKIRLKYGHVIHTHSKYGIVGNVLISLAPLIGGSIALFLLLWQLTGIDVFTIHDMFATLTQSTSLAGFFNQLIIIIQNIIQSLMIMSWFRSGFIIFVILNLAEAITPSKQDYKNVIKGLLAILIFMLLIYISRITAFIDPLNTFNKELLILFTYVVVIDILLIIPLFPLYLIFTILRKLLHRR